LKAALKAIIQSATARNDGVDDEYDEIAPTQKGSKLLNYDLQLLYDYVRERDIEQVVLAIQDTETFDSHLLSELKELLSCWRDRIPFVLLLSIATSVEFLQQRLSKDARRCVRGQLFDVAPSAEQVERVFDAVTSEQNTFWIGPNLMRSILERQNDHIQSIHSFVDVVQYAYMSCYYANALSIFLNPTVKYKDVPSDHFEAVRNLDSFRAVCKRSLALGEVSRVQGLLDNNETLNDFVRSEIAIGQNALANMIIAVDLVRALQIALPNLHEGSKSALYVQAMSNKLEESSLVRSLLLSIRKAPSDVAAKIFDAVIASKIFGDHLLSIEKSKVELLTLLASQDDPTEPLRSEDDVKNLTLRTTVIAQKVELSKQKSSLSKKDAAYTAIVREFTDKLEAFLESSLIDPTSLLFHEIFLYDLRSPYREVFTPRPRHAVERALAAPHDYLACDCCAPAAGDSDEATLAACQPATAVLYQLYLESGSLINVSDLWQAFSAVVGDEQSEEQNVALFQRALAELRYLGLVKSTRKRVDHVAKVAWRGL